MLQNLTHVTQRQKLFYHTVFTLPEESYVHCYKLLDLEQTVMNRMAVFHLVLQCCLSALVFIVAEIVLPGDGFSALVLPFTGVL
jgi:hypothetical protein